MKPNGFSPNLLDLKFILVDGIPGTVQILLAEQKGPRPDVFVLIVVLHGPPTDCLAPLVHQSVA